MGLGRIYGTARPKQLYSTQEQYAVLCRILCLDIYVESFEKLLGIAMLVFLLMPVLWMLYIQWPALGVLRLMAFLSVFHSNLNLTSIVTPPKLIFLGSRVGISCD